MNTTSTPKNEETLLYRNALLGLFAGGMFSFKALEAFLEPLQEIHLWLYIVLAIVYITTTVMAVIMLIKTVLSANQLSKNLFRFGQFEDEYFIHIDKKGYQHSFNVLLIYVGIFSIFGEHFESIVLKNFCEFGLALTFLTYSFTVMFLLKAKDE
jgi:hypothetical protein